MQGGGAVERSIFRGVEYFLRRPATATRLSGTAAEAAERTAARDLALGRDVLATLERAGPEGRAAEDILRRYKVKVEFNRGEGSYYDDHFNTLMVDLEEEGHPAIAIVHEAEHIAWEKEGRNAFAHIRTLDRDGYIDAQMSEEADALVKETRANVELQRHDPDLPDAPFQEEYLAGGREKIMQLLKDGHVVTPTDGRTYAEYYGEEWNVHNLGRHAP
ncbi:hypothetical protein [Actinoallomurus iriomotensis]|uniref:Uncharacterized protein n=1 Tax=Actinoallomurus iriomotensis TaxID=478107 RepID=A0A9W6W2D3_9ACTN|nr:hypothetical protein [Actinoallomurus iriomotensis]GLY87727.1 hypothetical protein Airi02_056560 [Actinoallomurus iriomotensis]